MYDYDIESLSGSLSRLEYEPSHESEMIQEIKYRIQQLESDIDENNQLE